MLFAGNADGRRNSRQATRQPARNRVVIASRCGVIFESGHMVIDSRPERIREAIEDSLKGLQTDHTNLYYTRRIDPKVPLKVYQERRAL